MAQQTHLFLFLFWRNIRKRAQIAIFRKRTDDGNYIRTARDRTVETRRALLRRRLCLRGNPETGECEKGRSEEQKESDKNSRIKEAGGLARILQGIVLLIAFSAAKIITSKDEVGLYCRFTSPATQVFGYRGGE